ncbi:MAG: CAP domain-containing protein [Gammaproteobacteria bacterium]
MRVRPPLVARLALAAGLAASALAQGVGAEVLDSVNWARLHGCKAAAARLPLQNNLKLQNAAGRLAGGTDLHEALARVGYTGSQFSALHVSGAVNEAQVSRILAANYCRTLTDPTLREFGMARRGAELWMVLAAPVVIPAAADADTVSGHILELVNAARAAGRRCGAQYFAPVAALTLNRSLSRAALAHSRDMAMHAEFDHRGHDGSTPAMRVARAGYGKFVIVGENIAAGAMTPVEATQGWLASPAHCENIMDGRFTEIGIAYAANLHSSAGMYWTQDFAARR